MLQQHPGVLLPTLRMRKGSPRAREGWFGIWEDTLPTERVDARREREPNPHRRAEFLHSGRLEALKAQVWSLCGWQQESERCPERCENRSEVHSPKGDGCMEMKRTSSLAARSSSPTARDRHINKSLPNNSFSSKYRTHKGLVGPE